MQRTSQALNLTLRWAWATQSAGASSQSVASAFSRSFASAATAPKRGSGDVPPGHLDSDLSPTVCNIGLGRRRDLTLRQDLCLWKDGQKTSLADVLKGKKVILVGFPGGPICTEKHIPAYVKMSDKLSSHGVDKVIAVTVDSPETVDQIATKHNLKCSKVEVLADKNAGLMRLLGVELGSAEATGTPRCQRFAAIIEDGILLKLRVEKSPGELEVSDCQSMLNLWQCVYPKA